MDKIIRFWQKEIGVSTHFGSSITDADSNGQDGSSWYTITDNNFTVKLRGYKPKQ